MEKETNSINNEIELKEKVSKNNNNNITNRYVVSVVKPQNRVIDICCFLCCSLIILVCFCCIFYILISIGVFIIFNIFDLIPKNNPYENPDVSYFKPQNFYQIYFSFERKNGEDMGVEFYEGEEQFLLDFQDIGNNTIQADLDLIIKANIFYVNTNAPKEINNYNLQASSLKYIWEINGEFIEKNGNNSLEHCFYIYINDTKNKGVSFSIKIYSGYQLLSTHETKIGVFGFNAKNSSFLIKEEKILNCSNNYFSVNESAYNSTFKNVTVNDVILSYDCSEYLLEIDINYTDSFNYTLNYTTDDVFGKYFLKIINIQKEQDVWVFYFNRTDDDEFYDFFVATDIAYPRNSPYKIEDEDLKKKKRRRNFFSKIYNWFKSKTNFTDADFEAELKFTPVKGLDFTGSARVDPIFDFEPQMKISKIVGKNFKFQSLSLIGRLKFGLKYTLAGSVKYKKSGEVFKKKKFAGNKLPFLIYGFPLWYKAFFGMDYNFDVVTEAKMSMEYFQICEAEFGGSIKEYTNGTSVIKPISSFRYKPRLQQKFESSQLCDLNLQGSLIPFIEIDLNFGLLELKFNFPVGLKAVISLGKKECCNGGKLGYDLNYTINGLLDIKTNLFDIEILEKDLYENLPLLGDGINKNLFSSCVDDPFKITSLLDGCCTIECWDRSTIDKSVPVSQWYRCEIGKELCVESLNNEVYYPFDYDFYINDDGYRGGFYWEYLPIYNPDVPVGFKSFESSNMGNLHLQQYKRQQYKVNDYVDPYLGICCLKENVCGSMCLTDKNLKCCEYNQVKYTSVEFHYNLLNYFQSGLESLYKKTQINFGYAYNPDKYKCYSSPDGNWSSIVPLDWRCDSKFGCYPPVPLKPCELFEHSGLPEHIYSKRSFFCHENLECCPFDFQKANQKRIENEVSTHVFYELRCCKKCCSRIDPLHGYNNYFENNNYDKYQEYYCCGENDVCCTSINEQFKADFCAAPGYHCCSGYAKVCPNTKNCCPTGCCDP